MRKYNSLYQVLVVILVHFAPTWGMDLSQSVYFLPSEKPKSTIYFLQKSLPQDYSNDPEEAIFYITKKNWNIPTKTYILQLLWWNAKQAYTISLDDESYKYFEKLDDERPKFLKQIKTFGKALQQLDQNIPSIIHAIGKQPKPKFTYQLETIPKGIEPELKTLLWKSLNKKQKTMYKNRIELETALHEDDVILRSYKEILQDKILSQQDKIEPLSLYKEKLVKHKENLTEYLTLLQDHEKELQSKTETAIKVNEEIILHMDLVAEIDKQLLIDYISSPTTNFLDIIELLMGLRDRLNPDKSERYKKLHAKIQELWTEFDERDKQKKETDFAEQRLEQRELMQKQLEQETITDQLFEQEQKLEQENLTNQLRLEQERLAERKLEKKRKKTEEKERLAERQKELEKRERDKQTSAEKASQKQAAEQQRLEQERLEQERLEQERKKDTQRWVPKWVSSRIQTVANFFSFLLSWLVF